MQDAPIWTEDNGDISLDTKDAEITEFKTKVSELELLIRTMTEVFGKQILETARVQLAEKGLASRPLEPFEALETLAGLKKEREKKEYAKMLEETNGFNGDSH